MKKRAQQTVTIILLAIIIVLLGVLIFYQFYKPKTPAGQCDYGAKNYIGKSTEECTTIKFLCVQGNVPFRDECGCGCEPSTEPEPTPSESEEHFCTPESRESDVCIQLYKPVCGWFDPEKIQCIKYPCANTYSNSCFACTDDKVLYYIEGECPE